MAHFLLNSCTAYQYNSETGSCNMFPLNAEKYEKISNLDEGQNNSALIRVNTYKANCKIINIKQIINEHIVK